MSDPNTNGQKCTVESFLGPSFNYVSHIRSPQDMQLAVSGNMWQFGNDVAAIGDYIALLIAGPSRANKLTIAGEGINQRPLGNSFMMETGATCTDVKADISGSLVPRSIFVNNIPVGNIPLLSAAANDQDFTALRGLVPGVASNLEVLNPIAFAEGLMGGGAPDCLHVVLPTIDNCGNVVDASGYLTITDLQNMDPCAVTQAGGIPPPGLVPPEIKNWSQWNKTDLSRWTGVRIPCTGDANSVTGNSLLMGPCACSIKGGEAPPGMGAEGFQNMDNKKEELFSEKNLTEIWIIILGILGLYILLKVMKK
jgi:hypothetical protein